MSKAKINRTRRGWKSNCRVVKRGKWTCWEWKFAVSNGRAHMGGIRAARFALILFGKLRSSKHDACHHCDNTLCVRPAHLYSGTRRQNLRDHYIRNSERVARAKRAAMLKRWQDPSYRRRMLEHARKSMLRRWRKPNSQLRTWVRSSKRRRKISRAKTLWWAKVRNEA